MPLKSGVLRLACLYLPNGNPVGTDKYPYKLKWMSRLLEYSKQRLKTEEPLILAGDFNVIPTPQDVHNPAAWTARSARSSGVRTVDRRLWPQAGPKRWEFLKFPI